MNDNSITFRYSTYTYKFSFLNTISNVRAFYPNEKIFVYLDDNRKDLDFYKIISEKYNVNLVLTEGHSTYIDKNDSFEINYPKCLERFSRILHCAENSNTTWMITLEDDVQFRRKIHTFPNTDFGTNRELVGFTGGGSIMKNSVVRKFLHKITPDELYELHYKYRNSIYWATDAMLKIVFIDKYKCTSEKWIELAEPEYYDDRDYAIFHGCKKLHKLG